METLPSSCRIMSAEARTICGLTYIRTPSADASSITASRFKTPIWVAVIPIADAARNVSKSGRKRAKILVKYDDALGRRPPSSFLSPSYYSVPAGGDRSLNAVWTYETPFEAMAQIKDYVAFYRDRVYEIS
jgi:hypothetical protein